MSDTLIENLQTSGNANPGGDVVRVVGGIDGNNVVRQTSSTFDGAIKIAPSEGSKDSLGRFRSSFPMGLFDSKQLYAKDTIYMVENLVGGGTSTYNANTASVSMTVTTANADKVTRQSKYYIPHQPGRGTLVLLTGAMGAIKANVTQRWGIFDDNNGIFFEQDGTNLKVVRRTSTSGSIVNNSVNQASWNLDKLNGTGTSAFTLSTTNENLFIVDFGWMGIGEIRLGVINEGDIIYCHAFQTANTIATPWASTPVLPIRFEIVNTAGTASSTTMAQTSCAAFSEGGYDPLAPLSSANNGITNRAVSNGTSLPMLAVRLKSAFKRALLAPISFTVVADNAAQILVEIYIGGTVTGGAYASVSTAAEANITGTTYSSTGATKIHSDYVPASGGRISTLLIPSSILAAADFAGTTTESIVIFVTSVNLNPNIAASLTWKEYI